MGRVADPRDAVSIAGVASPGNKCYGGGFAAAGATGYENTEIGQVIVLAYLDAYIKLVTQLGGLSANAAVAAPPAR